MKGGGGCLISRGAATVLFLLTRLNEMTRDGKSLVSRELCIVTHTHLTLKITLMTQKCLVTPPIDSLLLLTGVIL